MLKSSIMNVKLVSYIYMTSKTKKIKAKFKNILKIAANWN